MRTTVIILCSIVLMGASESDEQSSSASDISDQVSSMPPSLLLPSYGVSVYQASLIAEAQLKAATPIPSDQECRDRIIQIRKERGLPPLEDDPEALKQPMTMYAVDFRQDGCSTLVMKGDRNDIRPLPDHRDGPLQVIPTRGSQ